MELDKAYEHFSKINYNQEANTSEINIDPDLTENEEINGPISLEEIRKAVRTLKNNKSMGVDMILNEHIKYSFDIPYIQQLYVKLLTLVLSRKHGTLER